MNNNLIKTILITGTNRGIGYGVLKNLIEKNLNKEIFPYKILFSTRNLQKGEETLKVLKNQYPNFNYDNFVNINLDITSNESIRSLTNELKEKNIKIDILINNAGVYDRHDKISLNSFNYTFNTNVYGTINLTEKLLNESFINTDGKIILVASELGDIKFLSSDKLRQEFRKEMYNLNSLYEICDQFKNSISNNTVEEEGWFGDCYHVSKMLVNKYARLLCHYDIIKKNNIQVYSCSPGWVRTDMGGPNALLSLEEGVVTPTYLIELEHKLHEDLQGKFISDLKVYDCGL